MPLKIHFEKSGAGPPLILLHGFPMNHHVWDDFAPHLGDQFTVYAPDLPGFGETPLVEGPFSIDAVGAALNDWVTQSGLRDAILVGHSLGGYVALSMVRQALHDYRALVLFHSTAFADTQEKKDSRTKVLQFIEENGVLAFTSNFIAPLFANQQHPAIQSVKSISVQALQETVKAYTAAMRDRTDNTDVLKNFGRPVLLMGGEQDKGITVESLQMQEGLATTIRLHLLADAAHMGMFEKPGESVSAIKSFLSQFIPL